ncbi:hypothetical protein KFK09_009438 [Dendrobium nobile]|uniref:CCHC-type domain-containing protein n=1 Tax=Dendrobium nobile TaxID=94219 RepID=A0A8T3BJV3_DENNO|nr:hypothetical protein KFK09_009438 [Dendrobium nobile]
MMPGTHILDSSKSGDGCLNDYSFSGTSEMNEYRCGDNDLKLVNVQKREDNLDLGKNSGKESMNGGIVVEDLNKQENMKEVIEAWTKPKHIKINFDREQVELSEDGIAVRLNSDMEEKNKQVLRHSVVIKVLGNNVLFPVCSIELRRQWRKYGGFHLTSIGMNWILCSFKTEEAVEEILNGGPWYVGGYIVDMDRWSSTFDPYSFKGISAPIWIRFPCLSLYCWDEDNIARIASRFGIPMYIDGNTFRWGKREFARVYVIDLEKKLPNRVWVEGSAGRFFQRVEYEKVDLLCYHCGRAGHDKIECPYGVVQGITYQNISKLAANTDEAMKTIPEANPAMTKSEYGPLIHVQFKNKRFIKEKGIGRQVNEYKGTRTENMGNKNQKSFVRKVIPVEKKIEGAEGIPGTLFDKMPGQKKAVEDKMQTISITNKYAALLDDIEEEPVNNTEETDKLKDTVTPCIVDADGAGDTGMDINDPGGVLVLWNKKIVSFVVKETSSQLIIGDLLVPSLGSWKEEKRGGKRFLFSKGPRDMKQFMTNSDFHDVRSIRPRFTWCNNKEGASRIWERLDRCLVNSVALQKVPSALTRHLARVASDHSPIVFKLDERMSSKMKNIKFEDTWRSYPAARSIMYHSWKKNDFGDIRIENLKREILELQNKEAVGEDWNGEDLILLRSKVHELNVTLRRLSTWWNQRPKARWHDKGDINSKLFNNFATARRNGNRVVQIKDVHNNIQEEDDQIEKVFIQYFEAKWQSRMCELSGWSVAAENQKLNQEDVAALSSEFTVAEL